MFIDISFSSIGFSISLKHVLHAIVKYIKEKSFIYFNISFPEWVLYFDNTRHDNIVPLILSIDIHNILMSISLVPTLNNTA